MPDEPTPQAFFDTLSGAPSGEYLPMDRYRDFRAVFLGSEQGRRVLHELLRQAGVNRSIPLPGPVDPYRVMELAGRRNLGLWVIGTLNSEPAERPAKANSREGE